MSDQNSDIFKSKVLGHPSGLFVLFFTEMWERFSYYGMRALLVLFLVSALGLGGWDWPRSQALALYGTYTALVYITPILGGYIADKIIGYRKAVIIGALIMTLGHISMAIEIGHIFLYIGIGLLIIGNGFFKPNMTSIISHMYKDTPEKKDGAFTIFYMGVNAGAFLGILLCGYIGEKVGWSYGFGLAGIFMLLGMLQFYFSASIFGDIGAKPEPQKEIAANEQLEFEGDKLNQFSRLDKILVVISAFIGVSWVINDPLSKIAEFNFLEIGGIDYSTPYILFGLIAFTFLVTSRIIRYPKITRDRMMAIVVFAVMTVIFWMSFEQAGGSMTIFAKDYTNRYMDGSYYYIFLVVNILITIVPIGIISWVLIKLFRQTFSRFKFASVILASSFLIIWGIVFWMINRDLTSESYKISYDTIQTNLSPESYNLSEDRAAAFEKMLKNDDSFTYNGESIAIKNILYKGQKIEHQHSKKLKKHEKKKEQERFDAQYVQAVLDISNTSEAFITYDDRGKDATAPMNEFTFKTIVTEETNIAKGENIVNDTTGIIEPVKLKLGDHVAILDVDKKGTFMYLTDDKESSVRAKAIEAGTDTGIVTCSVIEITKEKVVIPATWFLILNSLFIIAFAPLFSKWWESKYNPSATVKYGLGLILLGVGFGALAFGSMGIDAGAKTASVSLIWLVLAYLFHTLGELCLSPVALSYVSKLVPGRMIAMMFGIWYIAVAIGNKLAGSMGGMIDEITKEYSMTTFFLIFTFIPIGLGLLGIAMTKIVNKLMHGVK
jgi:amino acid/peptide:H+ symporter